MLHLDLKDSKDLKDLCNLRTSEPPNLSNLWNHLTQNHTPTVRVRLTAPQHLPC